jgi:hypothetical protein
MKKILLLLTLISFLSCQTTPDNIETTIITDQYRIVIPNPEDIAGKLYYAQDSIICEKRLYKISPEFIGPIGNFVKAPVSECNLIGYQGKPYTRIYNLMEYVRVEIIDYNSEN